MFASCNLFEHLLRGAIGLGAIAAALVYASDAPWLWVIALPVALIALRGCPTCWTIGLFETLGKSGAGSSSCGCDESPVDRMRGRR